MDFIKNLILSLNTKDEGFSYRKLVSFLVFCLTVYLHIQFANKDNAISFLAYDFGFIAVLLGLLNLDRFVSLKFGQGTTSTTTETQIDAVQTSTQTQTQITGTQSGS